MQLSSPFSKDDRTIRDSEGSVVAQCANVPAAALVHEALNAYYKATPAFARLFAGHVVTKPPTSKKRDTEEDS